MAEESIVPSMTPLSEGEAQKENESKELLISFMSLHKTRLQEEPSDNYFTFPELNDELKQKYESLNEDQVNNLIEYWLQNGFEEDGEDKDIKLQKRNEGFFLKTLIQSRQNIAKQIFESHFDSIKDLPAEQKHRILQIYSLFPEQDLFRFKLNDKATFQERYSAALELMRGGCATKAFFYADAWGAYKVGLQDIVDTDKEWVSAFYKNPIFVNKDSVLSLDDQYDIEDVLLRFSLASGGIDIDFLQKIMSTDDARRRDTIKRSIFIFYADQPTIPDNVMSLFDPNEPISNFDIEFIIGNLLVNKSKLNPDSKVVEIINSSELSDSTWEKFFVDAILLANDGNSLDPYLFSIIKKHLDEQNGQSFTFLLGLYLERPDVAGPILHEKYKDPRCIEAFKKVDYFYDAEIVLDKYGDNLKIKKITKELFQNGFSVLPPEIQAYLNDPKFMIADNAYEMYMYQLHDYIIHNLNDQKDIPPDKVHELVHKDIWKLLSRITDEQVANFIENKDIRLLEAESLRDERKSSIYLAEHNMSMLDLLDNEFVESVRLALQTYLKKNNGSLELTTLAKMINKFDSFITDTHIELVAQQYESEEYWELYHHSSDSFRDFLLKIPSFQERYMSHLHEVNFDALYNDYFQDELSALQKDFSWMRLTQLFNELKATRMNKEVFSQFAPKLSELLLHHSITGRGGNGIEDIRDVQSSFVSLFSNDMSTEEKRLWFLLRRQLPFSSNKALENDIRNKAIDVQNHFNNKLIMRHDNTKLNVVRWIRQAVHNYFRVQTTDYLYAVKEYIEKGDESSKQILLQSAQQFPKDAQPPDEFFSVIPREELKKIIPDIIDTAQLLEKYLQVNPDQLHASLEEAATMLSLESQVKLQGFLGSISEETKEFSKIIPYLGDLAKIRAEIIQRAGKETNHDNKNELLTLDATLSGLFQALVTNYETGMLKAKVQSNTYTNEDMRNANILLKAIIENGIIEGDFVGFEETLQHLSESNTLPEDFFKLLNKDWVMSKTLTSTSFIDTHDVMEVFAIVNTTSSIGSKQITQQIEDDLAGLYKTSYNYSLDSFIDSTRSMISEPSTIEMYTTKLGEKYENAFQEAEKRKETTIPAESRIPGVVADKLLYSNTIASGYINPSTGERSYVRREIQTKSGPVVVEFIPWTMMTIKGVAMKINGEVVENPDNKIKELFGHEIVTAAKAYMRVGD